MLGHARRKLVMLHDHGLPQAMRRSSQSAQQRFLDQSRLAHAPVCGHLAKPLVGRLREVELRLYRLAPSALVGREQICEDVIDLRHVLRIESHAQVEPVLAARQPLEILHGVAAVDLPQGRLSLPSNSFTFITSPSPRRSPCRRPPGWRWPLALPSRHPVRPAPRAQASACGSRPRRSTSRSPRPPRP